MPAIPPPSPGPTRGHNTYAMAQHCVRIKTRKCQKCLPSPRTGDRPSRAIVNFLKSCGTQPTKKLTKCGFLRKRKTSSLAGLNHSRLRNAWLELVNGALQITTWDMLTRIGFMSWLMTLTSSGQGKLLLAGG
jgi:hypothetical protein